MFCLPFKFRINGDALFVTNGRAFDGHSGGAFSNKNGGTAMYDVCLRWCNRLVWSIDQVHFSPSPSKLRVY